jgi:hypothetical protein
MQGLDKNQATFVEDQGKATHFSYYDDVIVKTLLSPS